MFDREHSAELVGGPTIQNAIQHFRSVRRIQKRNVITLGAKCRGERERVAFEDTGAFLHAAQCRDVRFERVEAGRSRFNKVCAPGAARDRFKAQRSGAREQVDDSSVFEILVHHVEKRIPHMLRRRAYPEIVRGRQGSAGELAFDNAQIRSSWCERGSRELAGGSRQHALACKLAVRALISARSNRLLVTRVNLSAVARVTSGRGSFHTSSEAFDALVSRP